MWYTHVWWLCGWLAFLDWLTKTVQTERSTPQIELKREQCAGLCAGGNYCMRALEFWSKRFSKRKIRRIWRNCRTLRNGTPWYTPTWSRSLLIQLALSHSQYAYTSYKWGEQIWLSVGFRVCESFSSVLQWIYRCGSDGEWKKHRMCVQMAAVRYYVHPRSLTCPQVIRLVNPTQTPHRPVHPRGFFCRSLSATTNQQYKWRTRLHLITRSKLRTHTGNTLTRRILSNAPARSAPLTSHNGGHFRSYYVYICVGSGVVGLLFLLLSVMHFLWVCEYTHIFIKTSRTIGRNFCTNGWWKFN